MPPTRRPPRLTGRAKGRGSIRAVPEECTRDLSLGHQPPSSLGHSRHSTLLNEKPNVGFGDNVLAYKGQTPNSVARIMHHLAPSRVREAVQLDVVTELSKPCGVETSRCTTVTLRGNDVQDVHQV